MPRLVDAGAMEDSRQNYVYGQDRVEKLIERGLSVKLFCRHQPSICNHSIELTCHQFVELCHHKGWRTMDDVGRMGCTVCGSRWPAVVIQQDAFGNPEPKELDINRGKPPKESGCFTTHLP